MVHETRGRSGSSFGARGASRRGARLVYGAWLPVSLPHVERGLSATVHPCNRLAHIEALKGEPNPGEHACNCTFTHGTSPGLIAWLIRSNTANRKIRKFQSRLPSGRREVA